MKIRSYLVSALVSALLGLILGELLMTRMFVLLQPALGSMTFSVVELIGVLLIDGPLACLTAFLLARRRPQVGPRGGMLAGAVFLMAFLLLIVFMIALRQFTDALDVFGLAAALATAVRTAREGFGPLFPIVPLTILAFDAIFCMLTGLVGFHLATGLVGAPKEKSCHVNANPIHIQPHCAG
jgi:hypothetical protein